MQVGHEEIFAQRRAARAEKEARDEWFHAFHQRLYSRLLDREQGPYLIARARERIAFCEERGTCSHHYTDRWRSILDNIESEYERQILDPSAEWRIALESNSPFQFLYREENAPWLT